MTGSDPNLPRRECGDDAAPYLLGALEPAEARAFAHHLQSCTVCRDEIAALAPVLDVLPSCAPRHEVSAALKRRVMHAVRSEPRAASALVRGPRRSLPRSTHRGALPRLGLPRSVVAAAAAVAIALGVVTAIRSGEPSTQVIQASVGQAQLHVAAGHGELIVDHLPPLPPDRVYELWLQRGDEAPAPSTLFAVTSHGTAVLGVPGDLGGVTRVLVTVEPSGGSRAPTTPAVIVTRV